MSLNRFPHAFAEPARARVSGKEERNVLDEFIGTTGYATQTELSGLTRTDGDALTRHNCLHSVLEVRTQVRRGTRCGVRRRACFCLCSAA